MSHLVPSRALLRHLSRLSRVDLHRVQPKSSTAALAICKHSTTSSASPLQPRINHRQFSQQNSQNQGPNTVNDTTDSKADPQITSSPTLPDITSYYTLFPETIPQGPPPRGSFKIPTRVLRKEFLSLQSLHHPDKYTSSPVAHQKSLALSALINSAYKTLVDPLLRAQYLLQQNYGVDVTSEDNSSHRTDQATLMEVMEVQETFEEPQTQEQIDALMEENKGRIKQTEEKMGMAFDNDDARIAKEECVKLNFWRSLQQGLDSWEPGKEVRLIH